MSGGERVGQLTEAGAPAEAGERDVNEQLPAATLGDVAPAVLAGRSADGIEGARDATEPLGNHDRVGHGDLAFAGKTAVGEGEVDERAERVAVGCDQRGRVDGDPRPVGGDPAGEKLLSVGRMTEDIEDSGCRRYWLLAEGLFDPGSSVCS